MIVEEYLLTSYGSFTAIDNFAYVCFTNLKRRIVLNARGKNYLNYAAFSERCVGFVRHTVINSGDLALLDTEILHSLCNKLKCVFKRSVALNLEKHRKLSELRIIRKIGEVILGCVVLLRIKSNIYGKCLALYVDLHALSSALREYLVVPAGLCLDSHIRENEVLDSGIVILNSFVRLDKT